MPDHFDGQGAAVQPGTTVKTPENTSKTDKGVDEKVEHLNEQQKTPG